MRRFKAEDVTLLTPHFWGSEVSTGRGGGGEGGEGVAGKGRSNVDHAMQGSLGIQSTHLTSPAIQSPSGMADLCHFGLFYIIITIKLSPAKTNYKGEI